MKKISVYLLFCLFLSSLSNLNAQSLCAGITVEAYPANPQTGQYNRYGARVTLDQSYDQNITVSGTLIGEDSRSVPFSVTVPAGQLTAETGLDLETCPACGANVSISSVSPSFVSSNGISYSTQSFSGNCPDPYWQSELNNIGAIHNAAMDYAYNQLQQENLSNLSESRIAELAATYASQYFTNRYGQLLQFTQNDLYTEILNNGINPPHYNSLSISDEENK